MTMPNEATTKSPATEPDEKMTAGDSPDIFENLSALRVVPDDALSVQKLLVSVPVRKPGRQEFFRVHPDEQYRMDTAILEFGDGLDITSYLVLPDVRPRLASDLRVVRLLTCISRAGTVFVWPCKLPHETANDGARRWAASALKAAEQAEHYWVKICGNRNVGAYDVFVAQGDLGEPQWPAHPFNELLRIAFEGRVIDSPDHEVIRRLNGEL